MDDTLWWYYVRVRAIVRGGDRNDKLYDSKSTQGGKDV